MKDREPLEIARLRELARSNPSPDVLELLWEIRRLHTILRECRRDTESIHRCCLEGVKGRLAVVHQMRIRLIGEPGASEIAEKPVLLNKQEPS